VPKDNEKRCQVVIGLAAGARCTTRSSAKGKHSDTCGVAPGSDTPGQVGVNVRTLCWDIR